MSTNTNPSIKSRKGYCIQCKSEISYTQSGYKVRCYSCWRQDPNKFVKGMYCHSCGEKFDLTTYKPFCINCFKALQQKKKTSPEPSHLEHHQNEIQALTDRLNLVLEDQKQLKTELKLKNETNEKQEALVKSLQTSLAQLKIKIQEKEEQCGILNKQDLRKQYSIEELKIENVKLKRLIHQLRHSFVSTKSKILEVMDLGKDATTIEELEIVKENLKRLKERNDHQRTEYTG